MQQQWIFPGSLNGASLCRQLGIAPCLAGMLHQRGLETVEQAHQFLHPKLARLSDPFLLPNLRPALERILAALDRKERIVLYGDYDVDGVTSLALFARILRAYAGQSGASPEIFLPQRIEEGYGLSPEGIQRCMESCRPQLLIALDCGTSSAQEIAQLRSHGVDVLVFDHHEIKSTLPECPVVNPKLGENFHYLCSVGIVFKACHGLLKLRPLPGFDLKHYLDIVALGTVADLVPLIGENRVLVQKGLQQMEQTRWVGLQALMDIAGVRSPVFPSHISFQLAPRLNASGRLGTAEDSLNLLLTEDPALARDIAISLDRQNRERQSVQARTLEEAEKMLAAEFDPQRDAALVLGREGWHPGVVGIVAGRLSKLHYRPTLIVGFDENGIGKGSGRSIEGFSIVAALAALSESQAGLLEKFGGHEMAAGLTVSREQFEQFKKAFLEHARSQLDQEALRPRLHLDAEVDPGILDLDFLAQHDLFQPFGIGNLQPLFVARGVIPAGQPKILKEKHLSFTATRAGGGRNGTRSGCKAIFFDGARHPLPEPPWDVAFRVERNEYLGNVSVQMHVQAIRSTQSAPSLPSLPSAK